VRSAPAPFATLVGGATAGFLDQQSSLKSHLPIVVAILAATTLILLFLATGSVVLPVKSLVMNLLSLSAAFGLLVFIFQGGRLEGLLGYTSPGALDSTQPILLFVIAFALSTDYGVFLLTRIKEHHDAGGPNAVVNGVAQVYRELREKFRDAPDNLNPQVTVPIVGAVRHFFVADTDLEAEQIARPAYKIYYGNIVKLWRDHGAIPAMFTDDLDRARNADAAIVGSPSTVRDRIARYFEQTSCNYLVLSFAWGSLTYEQSRNSLDLFVSKVMPEFVGR